MIDYCEITRDGEILAVLDPPNASVDPTAADIVDYVESGGLVEYSEFGCIHWPWIGVINPSKAVFGADKNIFVPAASWICGLMARNDRREGGVYNSPAGTEDNAGVISGHVDFEVEEVKDRTKRNLIYPKRINPITQYKGLPRHIDGGRTLKGSGNFPNIGERRGVIFIKKSVKAGLTFAKHRFNNRELRQRVRRVIRAFLIRQMNLGAFRTRVPATAFYVDVSDKINPPAEEFAGRMHVRVGLATNKPAEWLVLYFTQDTRALEESLAE
jgi:hypothetical protein